LFDALLADVDQGAGRQTDLLGLAAKEGRDGFQRSVQQLHQELSRFFAR
jgi:hypothetical protein